MPNLQSLRNSDESGIGPERGLLFSDGRTEAQ